MTNCFIRLKKPRSNLKKKVFSKCLMGSQSICTDYSFQINILSQITQNMTVDLDKFTKIYTNCSEIQNLQNLRISCVNLTKLEVVFWANW